MSLLISKQTGGGEEEEEERGRERGKERETCSLSFPLFSPSYSSTSLPFVVDQEKLSVSY